MIRSALLYHVYSGQLFFAAVALFVIGIAGGRRFRILPLLAIPLALLSGTPMPWWVAIPLLAVGVGAALMNEDWRGGVPAAAKLVAIAAALLAAGLELPHHLRDTTVELPRRLIVVGDSLSSGGFAESVPWPRRLGLHVANFSQPSDTAATALEGQIPRFPPPIPGDVVLIEIGGNDMLERRPPAEFERALDAILRASAPRTTVMLELPVVPGGWSYAAVQRRLAARHGAVLVPKRILAGVLAGPLNADDGLHLTDRGHEHLARDLEASLGWRR
ncbi:MAG TPA: GDSL-type esterase/lipase family protein [Thermoanaerobaculia bacterium]|nr:GDSL-type esterase/lipase family protein [Thermoanaerobaculia bacterium]